MPKIVEQTGATETAPALDSEQIAVVSLDVDKRCSVIAGPGSGKTHTLVERAKWLVDVGAVEGPAQMLVISFTRAAAAEALNRLAEHDETFAIRPTTLDALAGRILRLLPGSDNLGGAGFDERVLRATQAIQDDAELLAGLRHVLIDEAQDLHGIRSEFVLAVLAANAGGFTVFGDPAQEIYGFSESDAGETTPNGLLPALQARFDPTLHRLTNNYRTTTSLAADFEPLRIEDPSAAPLPYQQKYLSALDRLRQLPSARFIGTGVSGQVAVLCRDNGGSLLASEVLAAAGIEHDVRRSAAAPVLPRWLAGTRRPTRDAKDQPCSI